MQIYLVTIYDYEHSTLVGAYSTFELAQKAANEVSVIQHGRFGPFIVRMKLDPKIPTPVWIDGDKK